jgi:glutamate racemase
VKKIGVFDSGVGGKSIASAIARAHPEYEVMYCEDHENVPYGNKTKQELIKLTTPFIEDFVKNNCDVIVIACNTVTTTIISEIRKTTSIPVIGIEPMVKPASILTKSQKIAVCATPATLKSKRYKQLKELYAKEIDVLEPDCSEWSQMIESKQTNVAAIESQIKELCEQKVDVIVLGCTHYHWIENEVQAVADEYGAKVLQPEQAIVSRLEQVLKQLA